MANKKFSEFVLKTSTSDVSHIVGYNGAENVQITPANFLDTTGGPYLPLAGGTMVGNTTHNDNVKSIYGTANDGLEIFHDGGNSFIRDLGTGNLLIDSNGAQLKLRVNTTEAALIANSNSSVELYYNNAKKFETTSSGISVTGGGVFTDDVNITQSTDVGVLNTTNLESGAAVGLSLTYPTSNVVAGDGLAISIGISGRGRSYIANSNLDNNLDASNLEFYTENGGVINKVLTLSQSKEATFTGNIGTSGSVLFNDNQGINFGNSNAKINGSSADGIKFFGTGSEKMRLTQAGNLAIGSTSSDERLKVSGQQHLLQLTRGGATDSKWFFSADSAKLYIAEDSTASSNVKLTLVDNGDVGIGTSLPDAKMHIQDGSAGTVTASSEADLVVESSLDTAINLLSPDNKQSSLYFGSPSDNIGCQVAWSHSVKDLIIGTAVTSGGEIAFKTGNNSERMRIDSTGNVGIGTVSPTGKVGIEAAGNHLHIRTTGAAAGKYWNFDVTTNNQLFIVNNTGVGLNIDDTGNVGIGTSSPAYKLTLCSNPNFHEAGLNTVMSTGSNQELRIISDAHGGGGRTGDIAFYTANTTTALERMRIDSAGDVEITGGYASSTAFQSTGALRISSNSTTNNSNIALELLNDASSTRFLASFTNSNGIVGSISTVGSATSYNTSSDYRLKEDLQDFEGLDLISKIPVYDFKWKVDESRSYGVMAHELAEVLPQAVVGEKDAEEMQGVDYSKIVPLLVKSIQELKAEIELLKNK